MEDLPDNVIQFRPRTVEHINGKTRDLGRMAIDDLMRLERECSDRYQDAQLELLIVQEELGLRIRGGDAS